MFVLYWSQRRYSERPDAVVVAQEESRSYEEAPEQTGGGMDSTCCSTDNPEYRSIICHDDEFVQWIRGSRFIAGFTFFDDNTKIYAF